MPRDYEEDMTEEVMAEEREYWDAWKEDQDDPERERGEVFDDKYRTFRNEH